MDIIVAVLFTPRQQELLLRIHVIFETWRKMPTKNDENIILCINTCKIKTVCHFDARKIYQRLKKTNKKSLEHCTHAKLFNGKNKKTYNIMIVVIYVQCEVKLMENFS